MNPQLTRIYDYILKIANFEGTYDLYLEVEKEILALEVEDLFILFKHLLDQGQKPKDVLPYVDKLMHVFGQSLIPKQKPYPSDSFLDHCSRENQQLEHRLNAIKAKLIDMKGNIDPDVLLKDFEELLIFLPHYTKLQNILFPTLESKDARYTALSILWGMQDQYRQHLKDILVLLKLKPFNSSEFSILLGHVFFEAFGLIQKEEMILFQVALKICTQDDLNRLRAQSFDYPFAYIDQPEKKDEAMSIHSFENNLFTSSTGQLSIEQLSLMLDMIPLDCTLIDEHNKVRYFNKPKDRVFPRSPAVIGRDVQNCHPAQSVHVVNQIIEAFRSGRKDEANFWINMKGHMIYIRYFALRDAHHVYKGTLEVTQVIDDIRALEGERRLLAWEDE